MAEKLESQTEGFLSGKPARQEERSFVPWIIAGSVVLVIAAVLVVAGMRSKSNAAQGNTPDAYASQVAISGLVLSQSSNMAGSQITYVDGQVTNHGNATVNDILVSTTFQNDAGQRVQQETSSLSLIRSRDPYIDIEPVAASPLKPGDTKDFRLIFDHVSPDWNQHNPAIQVLQVKRH